MNINNNHLKLSDLYIQPVIIIVYRILLDFIYLNYIEKIFYYSGFKNIGDSISILISWIILIFFIPLILSNYKIFKPSNMIITILMLVGFVPGTVMIAYMNPSLDFILLFTIYWLLLSIYNKLIPKFQLPRPNIKVSNLITNCFIGFFILIVVYTSWRYAGLRLVFNIFEVYTYRSESFTFNWPSWNVYAFSAAKVYLPIIFVYKLSQKKYYFAALIFFIQYLAFSVDGSKSTLFSILFTFVVYKFIKNIYIKIIPILLGLLAVISLLEDYLLNSYNLIILIIRRLEFVPNLLHYFYYDFFTKNPIDYFRQGILGRIGFESGYDISISQIIGYNYLNSIELIANNGLFSDAVANLGIIGVFIMPLLLIITFRILDTCTDNLNPNILIACIITSAYTFISSSYFTVLLTHGFIIVCIAMLFIPRTENTTLSIEKS